MTALERPQLSYLLAPALRGPVETTLRSLLSAYSLSADADLLASALFIDGVLTEFDLEAEPSLGLASLDTTIVVRPTGQLPAANLALAAIAAGEGQKVEFKSTLLLSVREWEKVPRPALAQCRCDKVIRSSLKTIAAFLNTSGGTLLIGVKDDGESFGLEEDMLLADPKKGDFDGWELELRRLIEKHFPAKSINSYVKIDPVSLQGKTAARVEVGSRGELSFVRFSGQEELYIRSGNRSIPVSYADVEQYFSMTKRFS